MTLLSGRYVLERHAPHASDLTNRNVEWIAVLFLRVSPETAIGAV